MRWARVMPMGSCGEAHKILEQMCAGCGAFFWMKLRSENVSAFDDGSKICAVIASGDDFAGGSRRREGMRKIKIVGFG